METLKLNWRERRQEKRDLTLFLKITDWIKQHHILPGLKLELTGEEWKAVQAAAGRIWRDFENNVRRSAIVNQKRGNTGGQSLYSKERSERQKNLKTFWSWTNEKKPTQETNTYILNEDEAKIIIFAGEIIEDKLQKQSSRTKKVVAVRPPPSIEARRRGGRAGHIGKGSNGKGRAGRKPLDNPSRQTLAQRRHREREQEGLF